MKTTLSTTILLLFTQFCFAQSAKQEQDNFWMEISRPVNERVFALVIDDELNLIAGMLNDKGVYLSDNQGETWQAIGLNNLSIYSLHIQQNGNLFAGTGGSYNIHRLINIEEGWIPLFSATSNIISIMHTYSEDLHFGFWGGIYKSTDNGDTWTQTLEMSNAKEVASIIETADGNMFAGITAWSVPGGGVYRSTDNGDSWEYVGLWNYYIRALATNSQGTLFAGSIGGSGVGIYSSDDNGETWTGLKNDVFVDAIVVTPEDVIYVGCSNEHGTQGGVFRSFDNGETWEMINTGLIGWENQNVYGLTLSPDGYLYAYGNHLHRSVEPVFEAVCTVTATANPPEGGSTSGTGEYNHGQTATLSATANDGYAFVNWTDTLGVVLSTDTVYSFTVVKNIELVANFEIINSIANPEFASISIYPNPSKGFVTLSFQKFHKYNDVVFEVLSIDGRKLISKPIHSELSTHDISTLPTGMYIYRFTDGSYHLKTGKIIIN